MRYCAITLCCYSLSKLHKKYRQMDKTYSTIHPLTYFREKFTFSKKLKIECMRANILWKIPGDFILYIYGKTLIKCINSSLFHSLFNLSKTKLSFYCTHTIHPLFRKNCHQQTQCFETPSKIFKYLNTFLFLLWVWMLWENLNKPLNIKTKSHIYLHKMSL